MSDSVSIQLEVPLNLPIQKYHYQTSFLAQQYLIANYYNIIKITIELICIFNYFNTLYLLITIYEYTSVYSYQIY